MRGADAERGQLVVAQAFDALVGLAEQNRDDVRLPEALAGAVDAGEKLLGVDRVLFAIDWPFVVNPPGVKWMETVPLCDEDKAKILSGNTKRLLRM